MTDNNIKQDREEPQGHNTSKPTANPLTTEKLVSRRDFITLAAGSMAAVGGICAMVPFVDSLNPAADVLALSTVEVDISAVQPGQTIVIKWQGKPVFIRHRTPEEIKEAEEVKLHDLLDPEADIKRVKTGHEQWLVVIGICTHLGCVPIANQGDYHGWLCPCHGSQYDVSGRVRHGPAPLNLEVPKYTFLTDTKIRIG